MTNNINGFSSAASSAFVVIGYGNPEKGDDAIGHAVVDQLQASKTPTLEAYSTEYLTPELSSKLAQATVAIFVDACKLKNTDTVQVKRLEPCGTETPGSTLPGFGHSCSPCSLLALTQSVYGHCPKAWWVEVPANDFTVGHPLSDLAEQGVAQALQTISSLMSSAA
ncbi:MAG: hydrogenase maturation protease [Leptolyngbyaceae cyanobacterium]|mgnify:CR=1 FL=1